MKAGSVRGVSLVLGLFASVSSASAHVNYKDLDAAPNLVTTTFSGSSITDPCAGKTTGCQSSNAFTRFGWVNGAQATLGDSHFLTVNAEFWKFHLSTSSTVTITFTQGQANLDPAFSVYRGLLATASHDDTSFDPLNPVGSNGCSIASPTDAKSSSYLVHDSFRDTLNYSTTGGLSGCHPAHPFVGQYDAFAGFTMANASGVSAAKLVYVASVSAATFTGNDGGTHTAGNHNTAAGTGETLTIPNLPAGDYTIAAGGEACIAALSGGAYTPAACASPRLYGTVSYTHSP